MGYGYDELVEARRQVDSTLHKLRETLRTLEAKENATRLKPQIPLARRRIAAFEVASDLIGREADAVRAEADAAGARGADDVRGARRADAAADAWDAADAGATLGAGAAGE